MEMKKLAGNLENFADLLFRLLFFTVCFFRFRIVLVAIMDFLLRSLGRVSTCAFEQDGHLTRNFIDCLASLARPRTRAFVCESPMEVCQTGLKTSIQKLYLLFLYFPMT